MPDALRVVVAIDAEGPRPAPAVAAPHVVLEDARRPPLAPSRMLVESRRQRQGEVVAFDGLEDATGVVEMTTECDSA